ncbi:alpha/beta fold hydrolase [Rhodanobacter sp. MP7CTX1]|uniref:S9 family peptidase n=1 Tax=Rhodanobacter sp. MP7CTX1 TaxID=2723084 RepID=UPI00161BC1B7|nr:alpha/beta fold hydrolase [Rhodanobacter sp. MP7CTX1]MBB6188602.1 dipeptidyl aminopeptidase/acylaminoacyl peptidase [Rhodanobacter sp. MP7CTX1]
MKLRHWIVALLLLCTAALHAQPVSFVDLARHAQYKNVKISPDGKYLAATAVVKGQTILALIRLADKKGNLVTPREDDDVINFWWASPTRVVYTVGMPRGGYDQPLATGQLLGVDADGSNPKILGFANFIATIPDDPNDILVAKFSWDSKVDLDATIQGFAYRMDVHNGSLVRITMTPKSATNFIADHQGHIRFAYGEDVKGKVIIYQHPLTSNGWQEMPKAEQERSFPLRFNNDDSVAYFACSAGSAGHGLCSWDPANDTWKEVWSNPKVEADGLLQGFAEDDAAGVDFMDGRPGAVLFDNGSAFAKTLVTLMNQFPGESVRFVSGTRDGRLSVLLVEADADPGTFYLYDRVANKLSPLLARASWVNPEQMASMQPFEFAARDGLKLQGYVSFPPNQENAKHLPMVVYVHGGPFGIRDRWHYDDYVQALATRGYAVLQVNYRGSGGYGYDFERAGWQEWGGKMQDDVTDATHWAIAQGIADPQRICIFGGSYGGYAALEGAVKEPDLYKCAIGYVGVYDLALMFTHGDIPQSIYGTNYLDRVLGHNTNVQARSPINQLDHLKAKVMLVVGGKDNRVPPIQGRNLHDELLKRHIAHEWIEKPGEMHGFYDEANLTELYTNLVQFVGSSIGPGVAMAGPTATAGATASQ